MSKPEICTITLVKYEADHVDIFVTSHPDGNDLEKIANSLTNVLMAMIKQAGDVKP
jgi:hypothetical protein